jgi:hypothetical protein
VSVPQFARGAGETRDASRAHAPRGVRQLAGAACGGRPKGASGRGVADGPGGGCSDLLGPADEEAVVGLLDELHVLRMAGANELDEVLAGDRAPGPGVLGEVVEG